MFHNIKKNVLLFRLQLVFTTAAGFSSLLSKILETEMNVF